MLDEIEIEHLRMALSRARKQMQEPQKEDKPLAVMAQ